MNDRIRELYQQAHSIRYHDGDPMRDGNPPTVYWQGEKSAEKFAELIVRECIQELEISRKCDPYTGDLFDCEYNTCIKEQSIMLKEHFGVEE